MPYEEKKFSFVGTEEITAFVDIFIIIIIIIIIFNYYMLLRTNTLGGLCQKYEMM